MGQLVREDGLDLPTTNGTCAATDETSSTGRDTRSARRRRASAASHSGAAGSLPRIAIRRAATQPPPRRTVSSATPTSQTATTHGMAGSSQARVASCQLDSIAPATGCARTAPASPSPATPAASVDSFIAAAVTADSPLPCRTATVATGAASIASSAAHDAR
jgi:hypothetical protein